MAKTPDRTSGPDKIPYYNLLEARAKGTASPKRVDPLLHKLREGLSSEEINEAIEDLVRAKRRGYVTAIEAQQIVGTLNIPWQEWGNYKPKLSSLSDYSPLPSTLAIPLDVDALDVTETDIVPVTEDPPPLPDDMADILSKTSSSANAATSATPPEDVDTGTSPAGLSPSTDEQPPVLDQAPTPESHPEQRETPTGIRHRISRKVAFALAAVTIAIGTAASIFAVHSNSSKAESPGSASSPSRPEPEPEGLSLFSSAEAQEQPYFVLQKLPAQAPLPAAPTAAPTPEPQADQDSAEAAENPDVLPLPLFTAPNGFGGVRFDEKTSIAAWKEYGYTIAEAPQPGGKKDFVIIDGKGSKYVVNVSSVKKDQTEVTAKKL